MNPAEYLKLKAAVDKCPVCLGAITYLKDGADDTDIYKCGGSCDSLMKIIITAVKV